MVSCEDLAALNAPIGDEEFEKLRYSIPGSYVRRRSADVFLITKVEMRGQMQVLVSMELASGSTLRFMARFAEKEYNSSQTVAAENDGGK